MRKITHIVIHCSATPEGKVFTAANIDRWHKALGWNGIGYHKVVRLDGTIENGRPDDVIGSHVAGHNSTSIGICYIGGTDANSKPKDTRTQAQKAALAKVVRDYVAKHPKAKVCGHRDFPGVKKACPSFDVASWWEVESKRCNP